MSNSLDIRPKISYKKTPMNDSNSSKNYSSGIGLSGLVFIVFLILKLAEIGVVASWSWIWVCSPLWIPITIVFGFLAIVFVFILVARMISIVCGGIRSQWSTYGSTRL